MVRHGHHLQHESVQAYQQSLLQLLCFFINALYNAFGQEASKREPTYRFGAKWPEPMLFELVTLHCSVNGNSYNFFCRDTCTLEKIDPVE